MDQKIINIKWEGPYSFEEIKNLRELWDYGIYQIYGAHLIYGSDVLLYIGKAEENSFADRIIAHISYYQIHCPDFSKINIYVGRIAGTNTPNDKEWCNEISLAEKLLIYSHKPPYNAKEIKWLSNESDKKNTKYSYIKLGKL